MAIKYYRLLILLNKLGMGKGELARKAGFSPATMTRITTHQPINLAKIDSICKVLKTQPEELLEFVDEDEDENDMY